MFSKKGTKLLVNFFNQAYFKVDSVKPIQFIREMCVIKWELIRLTFFKQEAIRHVQGLRLRNQFGTSQIFTTGCS